MASAMGTARYGPCESGITTNRVYAVSATLSMFSRPLKVPHSIGSEDDQHYRSCGLHADLTRTQARLAQL